MKDINNLTDEEREKVFSLLKPIGYKEGDDLHYGKVINGKLVRGSFTSPASNETSTEPVER